MQDNLSFCIGHTFVTCTGLSKYSALSSSHPLACLQVRSSSGGKSKKVVLGLFALAAVSAVSLVMKGALRIPPAFLYKTCAVSVGMVCCCMLICSAFWGHRQTRALNTESVSDEVCSASAALYHGFGSLHNYGASQGVENGSLAHILDSHLGSIKGYSTPGTLSSAWTIFTHSCWGGHQYHGVIMAAVSAVLCSVIMCG